MSAAYPRPTPALSPSRVNDFTQCPLLFRFRTIDRLPESPSAAAVRGTVVHAVLERLFDLPAETRTLDSAVSLLEPQWERVRAERPEVDGLFADESEWHAWLSGIREMLERYFLLEDPRRLEPSERELRMEVPLETGLRLRGYIDRLDTAPSGEVRLVDYKTSKAPRGYEDRALFQMRFYALMLWHSTGRIPNLLQVMYLGDGNVARYAPDTADLRATERKITAVWDAIERAARMGDWRPRRSKLCGWCDHRQRCPEFGGTPPPLPEQ